jgi:hypothetical protein
MAGRILCHYPESGTCGGYRQDGQLILQAEHLVTRSSSILAATVPQIPFKIDLEGHWCGGEVTGYPQQHKFVSVL